jgi:hypothetical protein
MQRSRRKRSNVIGICGTKFWTLVRGGRLSVALVGSSACVRWESSKVRHHSSVEGWANSYSMLRRFGGMHGKCSGKRMYVENARRVVVIYLFDLGGY